MLAICRDLPADMEELCGFLLNEPLKRSIERAVRAPTPALPQGARNQLICAQGGRRLGLADLGAVVARRAYRHSGTHDRSSGGAV